MNKFRKWLCILAILIVISVGALGENSSKLYYPEYEAIILGEKTVFIDNDYITLQEYIKSLDIEDGALSRFILKDLDNDGADELILEYSVAQYPYSYFLLHCADEKIYMYDLGLRSFNCLRADGTFEYASGAMDNGIARVDFTKADTIIAPIAYSKEGTKDNIVYYEENNQINLAKFNRILEAQWQKDEPIWLEYSENNILQILRKK